MIEYLLSTLPLLTILSGGQNEAFKVHLQTTKNASIARSQIIPSQGAPTCCVSGQQSPSVHNQTFVLLEDKNQTRNTQHNLEGVNPSSPSTGYHQKNQSGSSTGPDVSSPRYPSKKFQRSLDLPSAVRPPSAPLSKQHRRDQPPQIPRQWWYLHKNP